MILLYYAHIFSSWVYKRTLLSLVFPRPNCMTSLFLVRWIGAVAILCVCSMLRDGICFTRAQQIQ